MVIAGTILPSYVVNMRETMSMLENVPVLGLLVILLNVTVAVLYLADAGHRMCVGLSALTFLLAVYWFIDATSGASVSGSAAVMPVGACLSLASAIWLLAAPRRESGTATPSDD